MKQKTSALRFMNGFPRKFPCYVPSLRIELEHISFTAALTANVLQIQNQHQGYLQPFDALTKHTSDQQEP